MHETIGFCMKQKCYLGWGAFSQEPYTLKSLLNLWRSLHEDFKIRMRCDPYVPLKILENREIH